MRCKQASEMMSLQLDGRLAGEQVARLEEHLATCRACQVERRQLRAVDRLFSAAPMAQAPVNVRVQVMTRLARRSQARRAIVGGAALTLGTVALAFVVLAPVGLSLLEATGLMPALARGGPATLSHLSLFWNAASRTLAAMARTFAIPLALVSLCGVGVAVVLNGLWIGAARYLRAGKLHPSGR